MNNRERLSALSDKDIVSEIKSLISKLVAPEYIDWEGYLSSEDAMPKYKGRECNFSEFGSIDNEKDLSYQKGIAVGETTIIGVKYALVIKKPYTASAKLIKVPKSDGRFEEI